MALLGANSGGDGDAMKQTITKNSAFHVKERKGFNE